MLDLWVYPALTGIAVLTGFIDAIAGGGGLIMMPALLFAGVLPLQALATNKLQSVFGTFVAMRNYARAGLVDWRGNRLTIALVFAGASAGCIAVQLIETHLLDLIIPVLLVASALYILLSPRMTDEDAHQRLSAKGYAPVGAAVGCYDGFFGPGTGTFFTTSLVSLRGYGLTRATAMTKAVQLHQQCRQRAAVRARRRDAVAARPVHGDRRDGRRLAGQPHGDALRCAADPAAAGRHFARHDRQADLGLFRRLSGGAHIFGQRGSPGQLGSPRAESPRTAPMRAFRLGAAARGGAGLVAVAPSVDGPQ